MSNYRVHLYLTTEYQIGNLHASTQTVQLLSLITMDHLSDQQIYSNDLDAGS